MRHPSQWTFASYWLLELNRALLACDEENAHRCNFSLNKIKMINSNSSKRLCINILLNATPAWNRYTFTVNCSNKTRQYSENREIFVAGATKIFLSRLNIWNLRCIFNSSFTLARMGFPLQTTERHLRGTSVCKWAHFQNGFRIQNILVSWQSQQSAVHKNHVKSSSYIKVTGIWIHYKN